MPGKAVGQAAVELPWLCPNTDSLIALADTPANVPGESAADPALAVFVLRFAQPAREPDSFGFAPGALLSPILPETAAAYLAATESGVLPESSFVLGRIRAVAIRAAEIAAGLADQTRLVPAAAAATVARLAPLGWYAIASVDPFDAADPLADPRFPGQPAEVQRELWGLDHAAIARRLGRGWRLATVDCHFDRQPDASSSGRGGTRRGPGPIRGHSACRSRSGIKRHQSRSDPRRGSGRAARTPSPRPTDGRSRLC